MTEPLLSRPVNYRRIVIRARVFCTPEGARQRFFEWIKSVKEDEILSQLSVAFGQFDPYAPTPRLESEGITKGIPCVFVPLPRSGYHGMFIQFCSVADQLAPKRKERATQLIKEGYAYLKTAMWEEAALYAAYYVRGEYTQIDGRPARKEK